MESTPSSIGLQHFLFVLRRRWLPVSGVFVSVLTAMLVWASLKKPTYMAEGKLKFERTNPTSTITGVGKEIGTLEPLVDKSSPLTTEAEVVRSIPIVLTTINRLHLVDKNGAPLKVDDFLKKLKVVEIRGTDILKVSYTDTDPKKAAAIANTLMTIYLENNILSHRAQAKAAREFIEEQLPKAEVVVSQSEEALRHFKEENKVVALDKEAESTVTVITDLQRQITTAQAQMADINAQAVIFQHRLGLNSQQAVVFAALSQSSGVQEVLKELQQVESQLATERSRFEDTHPKIASLQSRQATLQTVLQERITQTLGSQLPASGNLQMGSLQQDLTKELIVLESKRQGLANQLTTLSNAQTTYSRWARTLPRLEQKQRELERKLEASQTTYSQLLQRIGEIRVAENQNVGNAQILSQPLIPEKPASSAKLLYLAAGLLAILAAAATAYVLEALDRSIKTVEQAKQMFGVPLLGVIPHHAKFRNAASWGYSEQLAAPVVRDAPASALTAAYRMLQANLKFLNSDKETKVIVVTSSMPKEGKSTVSANLALAMSQSGRQVLLVDADMHRPIQHRIWDLSNEVGLSNTIVEQTQLQTTAKDVRPNLSILTSGVVPPNSLALLDSQRMSALVKQASSHYDVVIIDTPPLRGASDALILGKMADGILLVVRPEWVDQGSAALAKGLLEQTGQTVLGLVANGVIAGNEPHSHYYFVNQPSTPVSAVQ